MAPSDRRKWDAKYLEGSHGTGEPSAILTALESLLPTQGRALDVAGGAGRHALWLAQRGLDVTVADISSVALDMGRQRATSLGLKIDFLEIDFDSAPFPAGPWNLILCFHFLSRPLFAEMKRELSEDGILVVVQPTHSNLTRHDRPPAQYLLQDGELPQWITPMSIIHYAEGWTVEGRHEAVLVAKR